jgi:sigma-54 dependent transcriptional regulator, acetoin dehydrogenase operon transcriptional activator AcoR
MNMTAQHQLDRANAVRARGSAMPPEGLPEPELLDSWVRCMQAGLDPAQPLSVQVVAAADLQRRRERSDVVRRLARAELETLSQQIAGSNFLLAFADREGVILDLYTDNRFSMSGDSAGIVAGSCWSESLCGTNGLGTALAAGRPVAVTGLEHYYLSLGGISCTAAPVHDAAGDIVGVLDASSYFESRQRHTLALVQMAATHIENGLLAHQMRAHWVLAIHPRPEFLGTLSAGLLAFDDTGLLLAVNARGRQLLQGLDASVGTAFESLFGEAFDLVTARLQRQGEQRLRDRLGSSLVVACVGRPPLRRAAAAAAAPRLLAAPAAATTLAATVADDPAVAEAYRLAEAAVRLQVPVLICGETGSGKEVLARHVHRHSRRSGAFVAVNCGALPDDLIEAELFGYVGGAFTGARREGSLGLIASADGGTLLLDEVRELPLHLQAALLRFLDDQSVRPVGGTESRRVDVQLLAATHADLEEEVAARRFRADLLYRLNTVRVDLPPLRARRDFAAAAQQLLAALDVAARIDAAALARLAQHRWPGNFRELRSLLTRALLLRSDGCIALADVEHLLPAAVPAPGSALQQNASELVRREFERNGSVSETARSLGVSRTTVYRHLRSG